MEHFLYVFSKEDRDTLLALDYSLIKSNEEKNIYVFENRSELHFDLNKVSVVPSNTLTL